MKKSIEQIDNILNYIINNNNFLVTSHVNPDGDNIGSSLAVLFFLKKIGKNARYIMDDEYPSNLMFLHDDSIVEKSENFNMKEYTVIALDAGDYSRICASEEVLKASKGIICIDHHITNGDYGFLSYIDSLCSSTCELVYNVIKRFESVNEEMIIDESIATPLYTGLMTDTGNFQYSNTNSSSFLMAADLIERGARKSEIVEQIYQNNSLNYYKILGEALKTLEVYDNIISVITVTNEMMKKNGVDYGDIDAITPYTRDIKNIELGIFIKEKTPGEIKVSLRSKNYFDCTKLAKIFNGGGHLRASGCTIKDVSVEEAKKMLLKSANELIKDE